MLALTDQLAPTDPVHVSRVLERVTALRALNQEQKAGHTTIRNLLNGGRGAVIELLGDKNKEHHLPVAHYIDSGLARLAQKLGHRPDIKVDQRRDRDSERERDRAEKRERIVEGYDELDRMELQLPQASRWIPGYGYSGWVIRTRRMEGGLRYPSAELRDPYNTYPGYWGADQQPNEVAFTRRVDTAYLEWKFPEYKAMREAQRPKDPNRILPQPVPTDIMYPGLMEGWETNSDGTVLVEYVDPTGTWTVIPETRTLLAFVPNPLKSGPSFVIAKRFAFDELLGAYDHGIGLMKMIATVNMLALIATQDGTLRETNIIGQIESGEYQRGRGATNYFTPGTRIERPGADVAFGAFQEAERLERQFRTTVNYNVISDAVSPNSYVTGQGMDRLDQGGDNNISEYQLVMRHALQMIDAKRLEMDETLYPRTRKPLRANVDARSVDEHYVPAIDIAGQYRTRRVYGVMAGWDESSTIVTGLQLLQARVIDRYTLQENLSGMENAQQVNERIDQDRAEEHLLAVLEMRGAQGDESATAALAAIAVRPKDKAKIIARMFPEPQPQPQLPPELAGMMGGSGLAASSPETQAPQSVSTVLSRLEASGAQDAGVQTVGRL